MYGTLSALLTKGVGRTGTRNDKTHTRCRRCGVFSYHIQKKVCASCGYGRQIKMRRYGQHAKAMRRRTQGTGRMRYLKSMPRKAKNGFRAGTVAQSRKASA
eukprot:g7641.t1